MNAIPDLQRQRPVGVWLLICAAMIFVVLVVGGITRLTHSGLSIVEWRPVVGVIPPLSKDAWDSLFDSYRATPEFRLLNHDMALGGFKRIFWWEYAHRLLGRLTGVVFLVPLVSFVMSRRISRALGLRLTAIFVLGAVQGALGWYMVASGLVDDPHVSQFRLTAHLGVALILIGAILWTAMQLLSPRPAQRPLPRLATAVVAIVYLMALTGAMVAGTHAGLVFNTFPLMNGQLVPADILVLEPWYRNFLYNVVTIQLAHRSIAWLLIVLVPSYWVWLRRVNGPGPARRTSSLLLGALGIQVALGIGTLLSGVALPLAAAHQAGAVMLFAAALWHAFATRQPARFSNFT